MPNSKRFSKVIHDWAEVFMHRSVRDFRKFMGDSGLSPTQINALMRLHYGGHCGVSDIGDHLGISNAAASQMADRLVQMNLLERTEDPQDRRAKQLRLSPAGQELVQQGIAARRRWMEDLTRNLSDSQQEMIADALVMLTDAARKLDQEI